VTDIAHVNIVVKTNTVTNIITLNSDY